MRILVATLVLGALTVQGQNADDAATRDRRQYGRPYTAPASYRPQYPSYPSAYPPSSFTPNVPPFYQYVSNHYHEPEPYYPPQTFYTLNPPYPKPSAPVRPAYPPQEPKPYRRPVPAPAPKPYAPYPAYEPQAPRHYCPKVAGLESKCRPLADCAVWYSEVAHTPDSDCYLKDGNVGACCPELPYNGPAPRPVEVVPKIPKLPVEINSYDLNVAAEHGLRALKQVDESELLLNKKGIVVQKNTAAAAHLLFFQTTPLTIGRSRDAFVLVESTSDLGKRFSLTPEETGYGLSVFNTKDTILSESCPATPSCSQQDLFYRTLDGSCNNLRNPGLGMSRSPFNRMLPQNYADGVWQPRTARDGSDLPSARLVSISVVPDVDSPHETETLWVMQYGQFLDHDITSTPVFRMGANGTGIVCCSEEGKFLSNSLLVHPECMPIEIPEDDPFFAQHGQRCMSFVRSMPVTNLDCTFGYAEQMNQLTHFLDSSNVYGSDEEEMRSLRAFRGGKLKVTPRNGHTRMRDLLPPDLSPDMECHLNESSAPVPKEEIKCFKAGDSRSNENPSLAVTHTVFMREHNRLATELKILNPHWNDEKVYQEARRIVIAKMQHITYNEYLPVVIGREAMEKLALFPLKEGFSTDYDEKVSAAIINEFATAAYRYGHSLVQGKVHLLNQRRKKDTTLLLRKHFFRSQAIYLPGNLDKFLVGLATQPIQNFDNYVSEELTNHLFEEGGKPFGMDLVALNIQRGRDHGLQGYNSYRELCGLPRARYFEDFLDVIPEPIVKRFKLLYRDVDDVDLFIGGLSERQIDGTLLGPTFLCIISEQFARTKRGDRYFYDLGGQPHSFTEAQLNEIRKTSLARLVCDNSDVHSMQPLAFRRPSKTNPIVECDSTAIPQGNLYPWQEKYRPNYPSY